MKSFCFFEMSKKKFALIERPCCADLNGRGKLISEESSLPGYGSREELATELSDLVPGILGIYTVLKKVFEAFEFPTK